MNERRLAGLAILLLGDLVLAGPACAGSWQSTLSSKISTEYESNPSLSPSYPGGVWRVLMEPSYALTGTDGPSRLRAALGVQVERSSDSTLSPNRDSPNADLSYLTQGERNTLGVSYNYNQIALRNAPVAAATGNVIGTQTTRTVAGIWTSAVTERSKLSVDGGYQSVLFKGGPFVDYALPTSGVKFEYEWDERATPYIRAAYAKYVPAITAPTITVASGLLGLDWKGEEISWTAEAGRFRDNEVEAGALGSVDVRYQGERSRLILNAGRVIWPSGLGGFVKTDQAKAGWSYALTDTDRTGIDLERSKYRYMEIRTYPDNVLTIAGAWLEHEINVYWKARGYVDHRMYRPVNGDGAYSNLIGISFEYVNPVF